MLQKVLIKDNTNLPLSYASDLEAFKNGVEYNFKAGVNIIVGPNGSGKSTLIRMLSMFFWCSTGMESSYEKGLGINDSDRMFNEDDSLRDGIVINHDYTTKVFILKPYKDMKQDEDLSSLESFSLMFHSKNSSVGEGTNLSLQSLFNLMFKEGQTYNFVTKKLKEKIDHVSESDYWGERYKKFLKYYKENRIIPGPDEKEITVLMDEPDRNLDIFNINNLSEVLSFHKPQTQIIASIHNPLLIYKLSGVRDINFIELEENYLYRVRRAIKDIVK